MKDRVTSVVHILMALLINGVPTIGWFLYKWPAGTLLLVYWAETVIGATFLLFKMLLQSRQVPYAGYTQYATAMTHKGAGQGSKNFIKSFTTITYPFCAAHGFFLLIILVLLTINGKSHFAQIDLYAALKAIGLIFLFGVVNFLTDLPRLRDLPFRWMEQQAEANMGRLFVIHLTIIIGLGVAAFMGNDSRGFFAVFIVLKCMADLALAVPQWDPQKPPAWMCKLMDAVPNNTGKGESFEEFWTKDKKHEIERRIKNERILSKRS